MARQRATNEEERHHRLLEAARDIIGTERRRVSVLITMGEIVLVQEDHHDTTAPKAGVSEYDQAILRALNTHPRRPRPIAAAAGHRFNSHFRKRLRALVTAGDVIRVAQGYHLPAAK